jgi:D-alanine-D-alanine ligase
MTQPAFPDVTVILGDTRLADSMKRGGRFNAEDFEAFERMKQALGSLTPYRFSFLEDHRTLLADLLARPPAFVLNFCDTGFRNNASQEAYIPALLEMLGVPYSGAPPACLSLCYDKGFVRSLANAHGVPVPAEVYLQESGPATLDNIRFPALIKPSCGDGSIGITRGSLVCNAREARTYIEGLYRQFPGDAVLVQEFLSGPEYSIGLIGNPNVGFTVLSPLEVDYAGLDPQLPRILAYESKADPASPYWTDIKFHQAKIDESTQQWLVDYSRRLFQRLGCRDYARFDFRADADGAIKLLEVNPNAAWCWDGKLNMMAGFAGHSYSAFLQLILEAAQARVAATR